MRNHSYDLHQPTDSFHDNQTHFYMKGFTQRLVLKQRHKDTFIHELLTGAFDFPYDLWPTHFAHGPCMLQTQSFSESINT